MIRPASMGLRRPAFGGWAPLCAMVWLLADATFAQSQQPQVLPAQPAQQSQTQPSPQPQPQQPQAPEQSQAPQPSQAPQQSAPAKREGFFDTLGRWWEKSTRDFKRSVDENNEKWRRSVDDTNAKLKQSVDESNARWKAGVDEHNARWRELGRKTEQAAKDAAVAQKEANEEFLKAQKEAADALKNIANVRMIEGRQVCEPAPNGSPDCQAAAEVICKGKGFVTGKSADITSSRKCSARALLQRDESECRTETVVIKAACQ